ncbi:MAG: ABC transporter ATP-binding protein [Gemmatimonadaceae bacterium]
MIELAGVSKVYHSYLPRPRHVTAVRDFTLRVSRGEVLGLAGPNGAGKSTLIAMMLGYLEPGEGSVRIDGVRPRAYIERHGVGYMSELVAIPPRWTVESALARYATLDGVAPADRAACVGASIDRLGLGEHRGKRAKQLSKGNLQRLGLAQALVREHDLLILDEPTHGLDPVWTQRFRELVDAWRAPTRAILIASHNLDELERVADRVAIIDRGRLQRVVETRRGGGSAAAIATRYRLTLADGALHVAGAFPVSRALARDEFEVEVADVRALNAGLARLLSSGAMVTEVAPAYSALEQQFRDAVAGDE